MTKKYISYISAAIFLAYGVIASKWLFIGFGGVFLLIGVAVYLRKRHK